MDNITKQHHIKNIIKLWLNRSEIHPSFHFEEKYFSELRYKPCMKIVFSTIKDLCNVYRDYTGYVSSIEEIEKYLILK